MVAKALHGRILALAKAVGTVAEGNFLVSREWLGLSRSGSRKNTSYI